MSALIASVVALGRGIAADYRPDTYQLLRPVLVADDAGGWTETEGVVESGGCILTAGNTRPEERAMAEKISAIAPIIVRNMPYTTTLTAADTLLINGTRRLNVLGVLRAEAVNVAVTAICEEGG